MWRRIPLNYQSNFNRTLIRTFLSESYKCTENWNQRLTSPILKNIKADNFYYELEQKFHIHGKVSAIDVDILANKTSVDGHLDALADIMHKHRLTEETTHTLDSTGHALIRAFLDRSEVSDLLGILDDRLSYGVFLDSYTANLCLDTFIKSKDFKSAAQIATFVMLQEDFESAITRSLSLIACLKYLENPVPFKEPPPAPVVVEQTGKTKKKPEEIKIRVKFLRNEYFDDHFDLRDEKLLVGKTLSMIGELTAGKIGNSARLLGYGLHGKYDAAVELISKIGSDVHADAVAMLNKSLESKDEPDNEKLAELRQKLAGISGASVDSFENDVCSFVNSSVSEAEAADIERQKKTYAQWCELRETKLKEELDRLDRNKRLEQIKKMTEDMTKEEEKLWFFENEEKIDLAIDKKFVFYPKRWFGKKLKPRVADENYVPPEVRKSKSA